MLDLDVGDKHGRNFVTNIRKIHSSKSTLWSFPSFFHGRHNDFVLDVTLKPRIEQNRNFEDLIRKCDILEGESEDL